MTPSGRIVWMTMWLWTLAVLPGIVRAADDSEQPPQPPKKGTQAPDFQLQTIDGKEVHLKGLLEKGPVALVVLRGYPGYQCPICSRQFADLLAHADQFTQAKAQVVLVYPGPDADLGERASEFVGDRNLPMQFHLVIDPGYKFTQAYGLRWDEPRETAYPSTFIIDQQGKIRSAHISRSHGDRTKADEVLKTLQSL